MYTEIFKVKEMTQVINIVASYSVTFTELCFIQQTIVNFGKYSSSRKNP